MTMVMGSTWRLAACTLGVLALGTHVDTLWADESTTYEFATYESTTYEAMTAGFAPHIQPTPGGRIDWTAGEILADGRGEAQGVNNQQKLMARRAAVLDAAANAIAIAAGVNVDANGRAGGMRNGRQRLRGQIKGHRVVREKWQPQQRPPTYKVTLRVPLWGVKSVSTLFVTECRLRARQQNRTQLTLVNNKATRDSVLVIDARGTGLHPCLFPTIVSTSGGTLFDINTLSPNHSATAPPVRYVETEMSFKDIQTALENRNDLPEFKREPRAILAAHHQSQPVGKTQKNGESKTETKSKGEAEVKSQAKDQVKNKGKGKGKGKESPPAKKNTARKKRRRKRRAVKAIKADGPQNARIVLTAADAEKLRKDRKSAGMLRHAEIVIVVDSAAAGIEGCRPNHDNEAMLAFATPPTPQ